VANLANQYVDCFDRSSNIVFDVDLSGHDPDGIAVANPNTIANGIDVSDNIFVNDNDCTIVRIDVNTPDRARSRCVAVGRSWPGAAG
jgi:hypothetical protein